MTPETFRYEEEWNKKTDIPNQLTPEQIEQRVLDETLKLSWLTLDDLKKFYTDCTSCNLDILKEELKTTPEEQLIEKKAQELYQEYINKWLDTGNIQEVVSLDSITKSIDSPRLEEMKNLIETVLDEAFKKYDFLDIQSKELVKIGLINSMIKSPMAEIWESLIGWVWKFIHTLSTLNSNDIEGFWKKLNELNPKDSGRVLSLEEEFEKKLGNYTKKFDEIQKKFDEKNISDPTQKQNIISHIDWFRNPALIEAWVDKLDINKIDYSKTSKNENPLDKTSISEYMWKSREKILDISKKLNLWDTSADTIYNIIENGGTVWKWVEKILGVLLKIPFLWKFLAIFLWLNPAPEKALSELKENSSHFKLISALKWLWISKDDTWKAVEWKGPFKEIDMSGIHFNMVKNEIKEFKNITWEQGVEWYQKTWLDAFDNWIKKDGVTLKFDLWKAWNDKKLTGSELKEILKKGLWNFNDIKEKKETEAEISKKAEELTQTNNSTQESSEQKDWKAQENPPWQWNREKVDFAKSIWEKIQNIPNGISLLNWVDLWWDKKLSFNKNSQELNIWDEKFTIELHSKWEKYNLKDIKITNGKVEFVPDIEDWKLIAARNSISGDPQLWFISKEKVINGITDLVIIWSFSHEKDDTKLNFSKVNA